MDFNSMQMTNLLIIIILSVTLIWLGALTFLFLRIINQYKSLIKGIDEGYLKGKEIAGINKRIEILEERELEDIQKVGFLRFNPFNETGGDNSFIVCLLNRKLNGIILTGLHTRDKTRMYAKEIRNGKSAHELSKEEMRVINETIS